MDTPFAWMNAWEPATFTCAYWCPDLQRVIFVNVHHANAYWERKQGTFVCPPRSAWRNVRTTVTGLTSMEGARAGIVQNEGARIYEVDPDLIGA
jgi:hypothetical protein